MRKSIDPRGAICIRLVFLMKQHWFVIRCRVLDGTDKDGDGIGTIEEDIFLRQLENTMRELINLRGIKGIRRVFLMKQYWFIIWIEDNSKGLVIRCRVLGVINKDDNGIGMIEEDIERRRGSSRVSSEVRSRKIKLGRCSRRGTRAGVNGDRSTWVVIPAAVGVRWRDDLTRGNKLITDVTQRTGSRWVMSDVDGWCQNERRERDKGTQRNEKTRRKWATIARKHT